MKLVFSVGIPFCSGELSEPSPPLVNCRLGEDNGPVLKAEYCQALYSPLGDFSEDCFAIFLFQLWVDLGVENPVILVPLLISPDICMPALPAKPLYFWMVLLYI
jgi:hypothetical protein